MLGVKIKFKKKKQKNFEQDIYKLKEQFKRITPQAKMAVLTIDIVSHCNLNCVHCDHFSPLAKEKIYNINVFKEDMKRLYELAPNGEIQRISLQGGEPLLAPNISEFIEIAAKSLPKTRISIISNGILANNLDESFWLLLKRYNVLFDLTRYPIKVDYKNIINTAKKYGVETRVLNVGKKTSYKAPLDLEGRQDERESFLYCYHANSCVALKNGKIYTCTIAPNIDRFNCYFNKNLELTERDCIDIHKAKNMDEILNFISKPIPFCKYCKTKERTFGHEWKISKKAIEEWS